MVKARSDNWRINKSGVMAIEGAQILKSLQKVAGAAGLPKGFQVKFASKRQMSGIDFEKKLIVIGAGRLFKDAPIPADLFDVLVGLTLHEVGHKLIETDKLVSKLEHGTMGWEQKRKDFLHKFANIGEDIAIESSIRANKNLAEYDEALHSWGVSQMRDADPYKLLEVWIEYALGHKSTTVMNLPEVLTEPMHQLVALTGWLRTAKHSPVERYEAYMGYWTSVEDAVMNPPVPPPPPEPESCEDGEPSNKTEPETGESGSESEEKEPDENLPQEDRSEQPETSELEPVKSDGEEDDDEMGMEDPDAEGTGGGEPGDAGLDRPLAQTTGDNMDDDLVKQINDAMESETEDISNAVKEAFADQVGGEGNHIVLRSRETKTPKIKPNLNLSKKLERIMTIKKRLQARTMHGEQYGRIDKRHLHRVATDERIFSLRYKFPDGFPKTKILLDLSGSMSGKEADEVLEAAGALQVLVNAEVWCYNDVVSTVNLVRMDDGKMVHTFTARGSTPSGLALVGVALGMKKNGLIIHLTDGGHNCGQSPWTANWILKKNGITLVNIIWGGKKRGLHYDYDGIKCKIIDGLADFPDALYGILIEQTKLSKMGGK